MQATQRIDLQQQGVGSRQERFDLDLQGCDETNVPTLMIWGENDTALGKELTYGTEAYVRNFQIRYIPNCSHWVQQERPDLVTQICESI
jgi:pimeloyl-ACP methyl ester carboxylesterase